MKMTNTMMEYEHILFYLVEIALSNMASWFIATPYEQANKEFLMEVFNTTFLRLYAIIIIDGHIDSVLLRNLYSEPVRCLHNAYLKVLHTLKNVIIGDVNENGGGQCSRGRIIYISECSLTKGHIVASFTGIISRVCRRAITVEGK